MMRVTRFLLAQLALLSHSIPASADVLRIGGPAADFTSLAAGAAAAADGDTLLVQVSGLQYSPVLIDGKSLTIVADTVGGARIALRDGLEIKNLGVGQHVTLEGFDVEIEDSALTPGLAIRFCQGAVRLDNCSFEGETPGVCQLPPEGLAGVFVTQSTDVALSACELRGGAGKPTDDTVNCGPSGAQFYLGQGGPGGFVRNSNVALFSCQITGGSGGFLDTGRGEIGGIGLEVRDGYVFLADCNVTGGKGSDGNVFFPQSCGGDGGVGLELASAGAQLEFFDSTFTGGAGGFGIDEFTGAPCPGANGAAVQSVPGAGFVDLGLTARTLTASAPVREGQPTAFHFEGLPGDKVFLMLSASPAFIDPFPQAVGPKLVGPLIRRLPVGTIGANGELDVQLIAPLLPPGTENLTWFWQGLFVGANGPALVGATEAWILVDGAF